MFGNEAWNHIIDEVDAAAYSEGLLNIDIPETTGNSGWGISPLSPKITVDRKNKLLKIQTNRIGISNSLSFGIGDITYFDLSNWTAIYGKPLELFLSLHLGTMMPDLTYDLASSDAFNTKVNIELQKVSATFKVIYRREDGTELTQEDIERIYLSVMCNMTDEQINRFADAGKLDEAFIKIINSISEDTVKEWINATEGSTVTRKVSQNYGRDELRLGFEIPILFV